jgi:hypothetical protein
MEMAEHIKTGCFGTIVSISASKHSFVMVFSTELSCRELQERGFPASGAKELDKASSD